MARRKVDVKVIDKCGTDYTYFLVERKGRTYAMAWRGVYDKLPELGSGDRYDWRPFDVGSWTYCD